MNDLVTLGVSLFGLVLLGYVAGRAGRFPPEAARVLAFFLNWCAMPALFFRLVATVPPSALANWSFAATATFATYCAFALAFSLAALLNRGNIAEATIQGLIGSWGSVGLMAPAFVVSVFDNASAAPLALVFICDSLLIQALAPLMLAVGGVRTGSGRDTALRAAAAVLHPSMLAILAGMMLSGSGVALPAAATGMVTMLAATAPALALFAIGYGVASLPIGRPPAELPLLLLVKLVAHPLITYLLLSWVGDFEPVWVITATLVAAMPPAAGVITLARGYRTYTSFTTGVVVLGLAASALTVGGLLYLIGAGRLPGDFFR